MYRLSCKTSKTVPNAYVTLTSVSINHLIRKEIADKVD